MYKIIIIGAGPASVTASLYLKRAGIDVTVIENGKSSLNKAKIENYYGFLDVSGEALYNNGLKQLKNNGIEIIHDEVMKLEYVNGIVHVHTISGYYECENLILSMGSLKKLDNKFNKFLGMGVSLCAHCDGPFYKNKRINVTGVNPYLDKLIEDLKTYSSDINIIDYENIKELKGNFTLEKIIYKDLKEDEIDNLFLGLPITSKKLLFEFGLVSDSDGYIKVNENYETNLKNVYAIGDMIKGIHQINTANYTGMMMALNLIGKLNK